MASRSISPTIRRYCCRVRLSSAARRPVRHGNFRSLPHLGTIADELCLIRSMHTEHNNHPEGLNMLLTCKIFPGRPVIGSWISYALGTENQNLPAYVVLRDPEGYSVSGK